MILLLGILGCWGPTSPLVPPESWILEEWSIAQCQVTAMGFKRADSIPAKWFSFIAHEPVCDGGIFLGSQCVSGWFEPNNHEIHYSTAVPHVVRHEAGHAILWELHSSGYHCFGHGDRSECSDRYTILDQSCIVYPS